MEEKILDIIKKMLESRNLKYEIDDDGFIDTKRIRFNKDIPGRKYIFKVTNCYDFYEIACYSYIDTYDLNDFIKITMALNQFNARSWPAATCQIDYEENEVDVYNDFRFALVAEDVENFNFQKYYEKFKSFMKHSEFLYCRLKQLVNNEIDYTEFYEEG